MNPAKVSFYYAQSLRSFGMSRGELEKLQVKKLRAVLDYADRKVPGYHGMFAAAGFDPASLTKVEDLQKLPLHSKAEMMQMHDLARKSGRAKGAVLGTTSGTTTGQPSIIAVSTDTRALAYALRLRRRIKYGMRPWSRVATLWAPERFWRKQIVDGELKPMTGVRRFPMSILGLNPPNLLAIWVDPENPVKDGKTLSRFRPAFINGKPSHLRRIARACGTEFKLAPKAVLITGEVVTEGGLKEIRQGFGSKVLRNYGSSGFGGLAADCIHETGMHVVEDYRVCEVLKDGQPVSEGEVGEVVVTFLYPDVVPAVRFRTGDFVRLGPADRCQCGSSTRRFLSVEGREDDCVVGLDGKKVLGLDVAGRIESEFGFRDFQLVQTGARSFILNLRREDLGREKEISMLKEYLRELVGSTVDVEVRQRSEEDLWLKFRPVVCRHSPFPH